MIGMITGGKYQVNNMVVAVLADDPAESIQDAADHHFCVPFSRGAEKMQAAVTDLPAELG